jgi:hypothetical protein
MRAEIRRVVLFAFFLALLIVFALPFKVESIHSTLYTTISGNNARATPSVNFYNAYQEAYVLGLQFFFYLTLLLLYFGKTKVWGILSIISSVLNGLALFAIYFALTFHINFYGPNKTMEAGIGFHALTLLSVSLILFSFYTYTILSKSHLTRADKDLLDADF